MCELLTATELAATLKVSRRWIHDQIRKGGLPHHYLGDARRLLRFRLREVQEWIESDESGRRAGG